MSDPVFGALAALEQLAIRAEESYAAYSVAEHAFFAAMKENAVTLGGVEMKTHEQIDAYFFRPECEILRPRHLLAAERAERGLARQAAHDELARKEAVIAEGAQRIGYREIETRKEAAERAVYEYEVMEAEPATTAGAVALLRFTAGLMETLGDDEGERWAMAIRNAADFFDGGLLREQEIRNTKDTQSGARLRGA